jgi:hypothetical protein
MQDAREDWGRPEEEKIGSETFFTKYFDIL